VLPYEQFCEENRGNPGVRVERARALVRSGDIRTYLGESERSKHDYAQAVGLFSGLAAELPDNDAIRRMLAEAYTKLAVSLRRTGDIGESEQAFRKGLALGDELVKTNPHDPVNRRGLAMSYFLLASNVLAETGRVQEAEQADGQALALREALAKEFPNDPLYQGDLASSHLNRGTRRWSSGDDRAAAVAFRKAREVLERLAAAHPEEQRHFEALAMCCNNLGVVLGGDALEEKEALCRRAIELREQLAGERPQNSKYQDDLAHSFHTLGIVLSQGGKGEQAERAFRRALEIWEALTRRDAGTPDYRSSLAAGLNDLSIALCNRGRLAEARGLLERAILLQRAALETNPRNPIWRRFLGNHHAQLAEVLARLGDWEGAARAAEELSQLSSDRWDSGLRAAKILIRFIPASDDGPDLPGRGGSASVHRLADTARSLLREAARRGEGDPNAQNNVAWLLATCPDLRFREPALAVKLAQAAVDRSPSEAAFWNTLGMAQYRAGDWQASIEAIETSMGRNSGGDAWDWLILAMAYVRSGERERARPWYGRAVGWIGRNRPRDADLLRLLAEARNLIDAPNEPAPGAEGSATPKAAR
jgi:tetratricopeptide (TPR) repeat protein